MQVSWRPVRVPDDVSDLARLVADSEEVDQHGDHLSEEEITQFLDNPYLDLDRDTCLLSDSSGLLGFGLVVARPAAGAFHRVELHGVIHPRCRGRGLGRRLLAWQRERGLEAHREKFPGVPALLVCTSRVGVTTTARLYERAGMSPVRWWYAMERDLVSGPHVEPVPLADGLRLATVDPQGDAHRLWRAHIEAFRDHWGSADMPEDSFRHNTVDSESFRSDLSFLTVDDATDEIAGYLLTYHAAGMSALGRRTAVFGQIGTRRPYRGRGVASVLIGRALEAARSDEYEMIELGVDADSPTGAVGLYERHGFVSARRFVSYAWEVPAERE